MSVDVMFNTQSRVADDRVSRASGTRYFVPLGRMRDGCDAEQRAQDDSRLPIWG